MKSENKIQQEIVMWFRNTYCTKKNNPRYTIFSVPNEGTDVKEQQYKKSIGMMSGVSDLIVVLNRIVLFVECKDEKGKQSENQIEFEQIVTDLKHNYFIVRSLEEFKEIILQRQTVDGLGWKFIQE
ncbi:MAG: VRR-NUC domain-containing protein [Turicibacter sp.]